MTEMSHSVAVMKTEWEILREEKKAFRRARGAAMRCAPSPTSELFIAAIATGLLIPFAGGLVSGGTDSPLPAAVAVLFLLLFAGFLGTRGVVQTVALIRTWRRWWRAKRWDVVQVFHGVALRQERTVAGYPVRTIVAQLDGESRYVRLVFARSEDSSMVPAGAVQVDLFAGPEVAGPARLRPSHGGVVWAFATRKGDLAVSGDDGFMFDGWPDNDPGDDSGWPGDSDGDGDGDGGE